MKKVILASVVASFLVGCGGSSGGSSDPITPPPVTEPDPTPDPDPIEHCSELTEYHVTEDKTPGWQTIHLDVNKCNNVAWMSSGNNIIQKVGYHGEVKDGDLRNFKNDFYQDEGNKLESVIVSLEGSESPFTDLTKYYLFETQDFVIEQGQDKHGNDYEKTHDYGSSVYNDVFEKAQQATAEADKAMYTQWDLHGIEWITDFVPTDPKPTPEPEPEPEPTLGWHLIVDDTGNVYHDLQYRWGYSANSEDKVYKKPDMSNDYPMTVETSDYYRLLRDKNDPENIIRVESKGHQNDHGWRYATTKIDLNEGWREFRTGFENSEQANWGGWTVTFYGEESFKISSNTDEGGWHDVNDSCVADYSVNDYVCNDGPVIPFYIVKPLFATDIDTLNLDKAFIIKEAYEIN